MCASQPNYLSIHLIPYYHKRFPDTNTHKYSPHSFFCCRFFFLHNIISPFCFFLKSTNPHLPNNPISQTVVNVLQRGKAYWHGGKVLILRRRHYGPHVLPQKPDLTPYSTSTVLTILRLSQVGPRLLLQETKTCNNERNALKLGPLPKSTLSYC